MPGVAATNLSPFYLGALNATASAVYSVRPQLDEFMDCYGELPLQEHSRQVTAWRGAIPSPSDHMLGVRTGAPRYEDQIEQRGGCSTIAHFSVHSHEVELGAMLVYSLHHLLNDNLVTLPFFGMSSMPGGNGMNVRGGLVLSERVMRDSAARKLALKLFPNNRRLPDGSKVSMDHMLIRSYPAYGSKEVETMAASVDTHRSAGLLSQWKAGRLKEVVGAAYAAGLKTDTFERQMMLVNRQLWEQQLFRKTPATTLEAVPIERETEMYFVSYAAALADEFPYRMIFDPEWRAETIAAMDGVPMCWDKHRGSHFFTYVDERGIEKPLRVQGNMLVSPLDESIQIPLELDNICELLIEGRLHFTVFLHMLMLFYFDILPLGGPMQIEYASQIKARLIGLLTKHYGSEYAEPLRKLPVESGYIGMPGLSFVERGGEIHIATAADIAAGGGFSRDQLELMGQTPIKVINDLSIQSTYEFIFGRPPEPYVPLGLLVDAHGMGRLVFHEG